MDVRGGGNKRDSNKSTDPLLQYFIFHSPNKLASSTDRKLHASLNKTLITNKKWIAPAYALVKLW